MLSLEFQNKIWKEYHAGADHTHGRKYRYSIQYNPLALFPVWIIRQPFRGGAWEWVQPITPGMQFKPFNTVR